MPQTEIILLSHGSRLENANKDVFYLAELMQNSSRENNDFHISAAFLQFAEPSLEDAISNAVENGYSTILITPLFLTSGVHITEDIPQAISTASSLYPEVNFKLCEPLGCDERLIPIIWDRIQNQMS